MDEPEVSHAELGKITKGKHDLMMAMPIKDNFCRYFGSYVPIGGKAKFGDQIYVCVGTERFEPEA